MADLSKIKVGDELRIPLKVAYVDDAIGAPVKVVHEDAEFWPEFWLSREDVVAAEHIPAPRIFKRGDWVRWNDGEDDFRHCIVLGQSETGHSELLRVDVPGEGVCELYPRFLEPDEAPE